MRVRISAVLLLGAVMMAAASAQSGQGQSTQNGNALTMAVEYNAVRANGTSTGGFWMNGGSLDLHGQIWHAWGLAGVVTGDRTGNIHSTGVGLSLVTATFGPRYTWSRGKTSVFGQFLFGGARGFDGVFPSAGSTESKASSLAVQAGGGVDVNLRPHLALRVLEADWLHTQLPNGYTSEQNDLRIGAGVVFRFR
jgi:hypothetical protein